jgi:glycosyltransferase involved in cell wall biosynthesis
MRFSIVIPTYNEEKDIGETLSAVLALDDPDKEIIVVDDSTDSTPEIVRRAADRGVRFIRPERRQGRSEARNAGIMAALGEVVVILNADVRLPRDFLRRIRVYYEQGYDYVLVRSRAANPEDLLARYIDAMACVDHEGDPSWMEWTEGFSCRREVAVRAGLFPTGFPIPLCAGEDGYFGSNLRRIGARKKIDFGIVVYHVAPASLTEFWHVRKGRGKGCPQVRVFLEGWSLTACAAWAVVRVARTLGFLLLVLPAFVAIWRGVRHSKNGLRDFLPFIGAWVLEQAAFHVGEWQSIFEIRRAQRKMVGVARAGSMP